MFHNITREERIVLKEIKTWENCCVRVQHKGSTSAGFLNVNSTIKGTSKMLDIIDDIYNDMITDSSILVSFDIVNMFPCTDNISGLAAVSEILSNRESDFPPAECILEALTICLECNNSVIDDVFYLQENGQQWALTCHVPIVT